MGELRVLDKELGDLKIIWDPNNQEEVAAARKAFDELRAKKYMAWDVKEKGKKGDNEVKAFNPELEKMIMTPPVQKG